MNGVIEGGSGVMLQGYGFRWWRGGGTPRRKSGEWVIIEGGFIVMGVTVLFLAIQ